MTTAAQKQIAGKMIRKTRVARQGMSFHQGAHTESDSQAKPGTKGRGDYYRIVVRPSEQFTIFRTQDVGQPGKLQRLAGKRRSGTWATQAWLVSKGAAHVEGNRLIADSKDAKDLLSKLGSEPVQEKGDVFAAKDQPKKTSKKEDRMSDVDA